jgi:hypothetical protein
MDKLNKRGMQDKGGKGDRSTEGIKEMKKGGSQVKVQKKLFP